MTGRWVRTGLMLAGLAVAGGCTASPDVSTRSVTATPAPTVRFEPGADGIGDSYYPKDGNGGYDVASYTLNIDYDPGAKSLNGHAVIAAAATANLSSFNVDFRGLTIDQLRVDDADARYTRGGDELVITPAAGLVSGAQFTVDVRYHGAPSPYVDGEFSGGFLTAADGSAIAIGEPDVAAAWFPVNDHPRDKATYRITVTAPDDLAALSNGVLLGKESAGGRTTWRWAEDRPMASYLATVVIGRYRVHESTHDGKPVVVAVDSDLSSSVDTQLARTPEIIDYLATQFGPYPFDAMGGIVVDDRRVNYALENQTRPIYGSGFFAGGGDASWVIAHELAHQWYGDSVSVNDWKETWLNEGFATYAEWLWGQHQGSGTPQQMFDQLYALSANGSLWTVPPGDPGARDPFAHSVYERGAMTLQALRVTVGDAAFFRILKEWPALKRDSAATTPEFIALAERISGQQLDALFQAWLYGKKKPPRPHR